MHPAHLTHKQPARFSAGDRRYYQREPITDSVYVHDEHTPVPFFPEGGVAAPPFMIVNPLSHGDNDSPGPGTPNQLVGPATAEWIRVRDSHEQGVGVDPDRRWPKQHHTVAMNFNSLDMMPFPDQVGPVYLKNLNRPARAGWSVPKFGEQYQRSTAVNSIADLMQTNDPASIAFAIGWGYVG